MRGVNNSPEISDEALASLVAQGDVRAFETLYGRYHTLTVLYALRFSGRQGIAEEATQDAFLTLWRAAPSYDPGRGTLKAWLFSIVRNRSIDLLRRVARHDANDGFDDELAEELEAADCTEAEVAATEQAQHARRLLTDLPSEQREVIVLSFFKGLSHSEIAASIGIPLGTVKGRQRLGLTRMRRALVSSPSLARMAG